MKVVFPNPFGKASLTEEKVEELRGRLGFSDAYAKFLGNQNGFSFEDLEASESGGAYLTESELDSDGSADIRVLYSAGVDDPHYDLEKNNDTIFQGLFLSIGQSYGGGDFVEILVGKHKGRIASLDHELHASCDDLDEFFREFDLEHLTESTSEERADALADDELGLLWFHAQQFQDFLTESIHCDASFTGFVVDGHCVRDSEGGD